MKVSGIAKSQPATLNYASSFLVPLLPLKTELAQLAKQLVSYKGQQPLHPGAHLFHMPGLYSHHLIPPQPPLAVIAPPSRQNPLLHLSLLLRLQAEQTGQYRR
ncbi:unnamed protein product [Schistocephalus solidus]|uniref:Uncharacterized protein n=1 Tax=Schistocephalus solidus TaxID=70667 RepID=A0A183TBX5_SCHSO|nr:unnamed protein product [Schistocephalus solidus]